jgi:hypothetical protein
VRYGSNTERVFGESLFSPEQEFGIKILRCEQSSSVPTSRRTPAGQPKGLPLRASVRPTSVRTAVPPICSGHIDRGIRKARSAHYDKNVVVVEAGSKRVDYPSGTQAGRAADKSIADREGIVSPPGTVLYKDSGLQGHEPAGGKTRQAKKKPAGGERTAAERRANRKPGRIRVRVEHALAGVKRCRIVKMSCGTRPKTRPIQSGRSLVGCTMFGLRSAGGDEKPHENLSSDQVY